MSLFILLPEKLRRPVLPAPTTGRTLGKQRLQQQMIKRLDLTPLDDADVELLLVWTQHNEENKLHPKHFDKLPQ